MSYKFIEITPVIQKDINRQFRGGYRPGQTAGEEAQGGQA